MYDNYVSATTGLASGRPNGDLQNDEFARWSTRVTRVYTEEMRTVSHCQTNAGETALRKVTSGIVIC